MIDRRYFMNDRYKMGGKMNAERIYSSSDHGPSSFTCYDIAHVNVQTALLMSIDPNYDDAMHLDTPEANLEETLEFEIKRRRDRDRILGLPQDSDPAWNIMLDLLQAHFRKLRISVSSACIASKAPSTTALRYLALLEKDGLVVRQPDATDARRQFVFLSELGMKLMHKYLLVAHSYKI